MSTLDEIRESYARAPEQREQEDTSGWNICDRCQQPIRSGHLAWRPLTQGGGLVSVCDTCDPP